jgi:hypothetical protein
MKPQQHVNQQTYSLNNYISNNLTKLSYICNKVHAKTQSIIKYDTLNGYFTEDN